MKSVYASNRRQRALNVEVLISEMTLKPIVTNVECSRPLAHRLSLSMKFNPAILGRIVLLFNACRPSAIIRTIRAVIVTTIQAVFWCGSLAHVRQKISKGIPPAITDANPARSVIAIQTRFRVVATRFHTDPDSIFRGCVDTLRAVFSQRWAGMFLAPARFHFAGPQGSRAHCFLLSTFASADVIATRCWRLTDHGQAEKDHADRNGFPCRHTVPDYIARQFLAAIGEPVEGTS